MKAIFME